MVIVYTYISVILFNLDFFIRFKPFNITNEARELNEIK